MNVLMFRGQPAKKDTTIHIIINDICIDTYLVIQISRVQMYNMYLYMSTMIRVVQCFFCMFQFWMTYPVFCSPRDDSFGLIFDNGLV